MTPGQSLADGAAGITLLHIETGRTDSVRAKLEQAVAGGVSAAGTASVYYGAPALAFVLATCNDPRLARAGATAAEGTRTITRRRLDAAHRRIDHRRRPPYAEYDLIRGLTGLGVALRRAGDTTLLRDVLAYLVRLTEPIGGLPGWWCPHGPDRDRPCAPGGHSNQGIAHGITGCLALLALGRLDGIHVHGHTDGIERILRWLDSWKRHTDGGVTWWPQALTLADLDRGEPSQPGPLRPSWCYGTPGLARAQQLAARATGDTARQRDIEDAFNRCIADTTQMSRLTDRSLCHGTGGLLVTARRIASDAITSVPLTRMDHLHRHTAAAPGEPPGFLTGTAGAGLAATGTRTSWDACLLLC